MKHLDEILYGLYVKANTKRRIKSGGGNKITNAIANIRIKSGYVKK